MTTIAERIFEQWEKEPLCTTQDLVDLCEAEDARKEYYNILGDEADAYVFADNSWIEVNWAGYHRAWHEEWERHE